MLWNGDLARITDLNLIFFYVQARLTELTESVESNRQRHGQRVIRVPREGSSLSTRQSRQRPQARVRRSRFEVRLPGGAVAGAGVHRPISSPCRVGPVSWLTPPLVRLRDSLLRQPLMPVHLWPFTRGHSSCTTSSWAYQMLSSKYCHAMPWRWRNMACSFRPSRIADAGPNHNVHLSRSRSD